MHTQNYIYPFQNLSLGFILKIFLKSRKFHSRYSYKIYSYKKKRVYPEKLSVNFSGSSFEVRVILLHPCFFIVCYHLYGVFAF